MRRPVRNIYQRASIYSLLLLPVIHLHILKRLALAIDALVSLDHYLAIFAEGFMPYANLDPIM
jgi:hypothetical protein